MGRGETVCRAIPFGHREESSSGHRLPTKTCMKASETGEKSELVTESAA